MIKKIAVTVGLVIAATLCAIGLFLGSFAVAVLVLVGGDIEYSFQYTDASGTMTFTNKE